MQDDNFLEFISVEDQWQSFWYQYFKTLLRVSKVIEIAWFACMRAWHSTEEFLGISKYGIVIYVYNTYIVWYLNIILIAQWKHYTIVIYGSGFIEVSFRHINIDQTGSITTYYLDVALYYRKQNHCTYYYGW